MAEEVKMAEVEVEEVEVADLINPQLKMINQRARRCSLKGELATIVENVDI